MRVQVFTHMDGDWLDVFINNRKVYGGHTISPYELLQLLSEANCQIELAPFVEWREDPNTEMPPVINGYTLGVR